jgi:hypothetical protein
MLDARGAEFSALLTAECGAIGPWGHFNAHFAASLMREAASMTTQVTGEVIPSDKAQQFRHWPSANARRRGSWAWRRGMRR